jgi:oxidase EvaA
MARDNLVNMCTRSILSCLPYAAAAEEVPAGGVSSAVDGSDVALNSTPEVLSWFTGLRADLRPEIGRIPLRDVPGWQRTEKEIARYDGRYFKIIAVSVQAASREVSGWTQPLLEPNGPGLAAGIVKEFGGVLHVMMHAKVEGGLLNVAELGPTVQCRPGDFDAGERPLFHDYVTEADPARIRFDAVQPEEGGRFSNAETRCLVVEADDSLPAELPPDYIWITLGQLTELLRHGQYVNMHGRTLIACLHAMGRRA